MLDSCHPRLGFGPSARAHSKFHSLPLKWNCTEPLNPSKSHVIVSIKHINCQRCGEPRISQINILDVSAAGSHPAVLKQQIRANGETTRENECRESDPDTQSEHRRENVTGNSFTGGWWGGEEVDKAETRGNSDILKWYSTKVIHPIMWEIQSGSGTFP